MDTRSSVRVARVTVGEHGNLCGVGLKLGTAIQARLQCPVILSRRTQLEDGLRLTAEGPH